ncbi:MAG: N-acyl homoserine lactonase family protein [Betaproteobacteria bacterium]|jgi:N-acyl homoserine lactone hydrolase|nr:N-acyl homoserine lactonase family protein [Betaproteobacteria bacterium]
MQIHRIGTTHRAARNATGALAARVGVVALCAALALPPSATAQTQTQPQAQPQTGAQTGTAPPATSTATALPREEVTLTRLDCGTAAPPADVSRFNDTFAWPRLVLQLVYSCYLVRHGDDYLLWDTGQSMAAGALAPKTSLVDQLAALRVRPEQVKYVAISHYHPDHTGQLASFPQATLLIGRADWDVLTAPARPGSTTAATFAAPFAHWISGAGKVEALPQDKDLFGNGAVVLLATPGHTPGHKSLLVRLRELGPVLITGDLAHFHENYESGGVPPFNTSRAETTASLDRFKKIATQLRATVIIQHDARDVSKLPAFPGAAR